MFQDIRLGKGCYGISYIIKYDKKLVGCLFYVILVVLLEKM